MSIMVMCSLSAAVASELGSELNFFATAYVFMCRWNILELKSLSYVLFIRRGNSIIPSQMLIA